MKHQRKALNGLFDGVYVPQLSLDNKPLPPVPHEQILIKRACLPQTMSHSIPSGSLETLYDSQNRLEKRFKLNQAFLEKMDTQ